VQDGGRALSSPKNFKTPLPKLAVGFFVSHGRVIHGHNQIPPPNTKEK